MTDYPICTVIYPDGERCIGRAHGGGICSAHRRRRALFGDPLIGGKVNQYGKGAQWCSIGRVAPWLDEPECPKKCLSKGFCGLHYGRFTRQGDPLCLNYDRSEDAACPVEGCERRSTTAAGGFCRRHYRRARANGGDPLGGSRNSDLLERLQRRVADGPMPIRFYNPATDGYDAVPPCACRDWMGAIGYRRGHLTYGLMSVDDVRRTVHRVTYELANGPVPEGLHLDHLCCRPMCCEPRHLEPVTMRENLRRSALVERAITDRYRDEFFGGTLNLRGAEAVAAAIFFAV